MVVAMPPKSPSASATLHARQACLPGNLGIERLVFMGISSQFSLPREVNWGERTNRAVSRRATRRVLQRTSRSCRFLSLEAACPNGQVPFSRTPYFLPILCFIRLRYPRSYQHFSRQFHQVRKEVASS